VRSDIASRPGPFTVAFAGSIYLDRDPRPLFEAAARLVSERGLTLDEFQIVFVGNVAEHNGRPVRELAASAGVSDYVDLRSAVPRDELAGILQSASVLISLQQDSDLAIPSKIYEYAEYPAWVLAISEPGSATGRLLAGTRADVVAPGSTDAIYEALNARYREHEAGRWPRPLAEDPRFQRSTQAAILVSALETVTGERQSPRRTSS
jgi:glycosyltransferase involved in cell wall biosynthesis